MESVRQMADEAAHPSFDVEAACVLLMIVSRLPEAAMSLEDRVGIVGLMGRRHCVSRATTELLAAAARRDGQLVDQIRSCHAEVSGTAEQAMTHSLRGQPTLAVKNLLEQGQRTCNAKLIDMAGLVARRHADAIEDYSVLLAAADDLQQRFGQPVTHLAGVRRVGRAPGGMALRC